MVALRVSRASIRSTHKWIWTQAYFAIYFFSTHFYWFQFIWQLFANNHFYKIQITFNCNRREGVIGRHLKNTKKNQLHYENHNESERIILLMIAKRSVTSIRNQLSVSNIPLKNKLISDTQRKYAFSICQLVVRLRSMREYEK